MTDREKLINLLCAAHNISTEAACFENMTYAGQLRMEADHLIANGVTFATDNNVGDKMTPTDKDTNVPSKWISVKDRLPDDFGQFLCVVLRHIRGGKYVREFRVLWCDYDHSWGCEDLIVTHWMPMPQPPKGE